MKEEDLISAVRERAVNPATRTDYIGRRHVEIGISATSDTIAKGEHILGCRFHPLHRRLFEEVGNGGYGPGDGLIGLPGGALDINGRSIIELKSTLSLNYKTSPLGTVIPLCDWGSGVWSCIVSDTGVIVTLSEFGAKETKQSFHLWLEDWVSGTNIWKNMIILEDRVVVNPFTRHETVVQAVVGIRGKEYVR